MRKPVSFRSAAIVAAMLLLSLIMAACSGDEASSLKPETFAYDPGEAFTTNFSAPADTKKMLKCKVVFEVTDQKAATTLVEENYIVRDAVIKELKNLTLAEATESGDSDALKQRLVDAVNAALGTDIFYAAYFEEFSVA